MFHVKHRLQFLALLLLALCTACTDTGAGAINSAAPEMSVSPQSSPAADTPSPPSVPPVTEDLGDGYAQVTQYDIQGRKIREDVFYTGEWYEYNGLYDPRDPPEPENVENRPVGWSLYEYDTEGCAVLRREYAAEDPEVPRLTEGTDPQGRTVLYEKRGGLMLFTPECRWTFSYLDGSDEVEVSLTVFSVFDSRYPDTPTENSWVATHRMAAPDNRTMPGGFSAGPDGISGLYVLETDSSGEPLCQVEYNAAGEITNRYVIGEPAG